MGILKNPRHERFVQGLLEGLPASRAFAEAGYAPNDGNAIRLKGNEKVQARLAELQGEAARSAKITVESICAELEEAVGVARSKSQAQAMVSAITFKARLAGLLVERVEVGSPGDFDNCTSTAQIVDRVLERLIEQFRPVDEADRQGLIALYERHLEETQQYIDAINARPIVAERVDPRHLDRPWQQLKPYAPTAPRRIGYRDGNASNRA
jgi:phage terminase small subunit